MRSFIITEDVLSAVARCIGMATHPRPYGEVAAIVDRLQTLPEAPSLEATSVSELVGSARGSEATDPVDDAAEAA